MIKEINMRKALRNIVLALVLAAAAASLFASGAQEGADGLVTVRLGVVGGIYDDLWAPAIETLKEEGINLQLIQFSDYVTPNNALSSGEIDLNAFQHRIYLESELEAYGYDLTIVGNSFIIPLNLYSEKITSFDELKDGDTIAIPNDVTNGGRAIKVLADAGLFELDPEAGFNPTVKDIVKYNKQVEIKELAANTIASALPDVTAGIVNGGYAIDYGLKTDEAVLKDTSVSESEYWNIIVARTKDLEDPEKKELYRKVVKAFQQPETERVFNEDFGGYFIKAGWDIDLI